MEPLLDWLERSNASRFLVCPSDLKDQLPLDPSDNKNIASGAREIRSALMSSSRTSQQDPM
eukprot:3991973-Prorocentrum_lima.AAC.1